MKEIPMPLIKANQAGIVLFVLLAILLQMPVFIYILWIMQIIHFAIGMKANVIVLLARPFLRKRLAGSETQAAELARFNQTIAVVLLTLASLLLLIGWQPAGYIAAGMVAIAAGAAVSGYCIGCTIYFQYKKWKALRTS